MDWYFGQDLDEMTVRISQFIGEDAGSMILRIEGTLNRGEAQLLEQTCSDLRKDNLRMLVLDLRGVTFLHPEGAELIRSLKEQEGISLTGCQLFTQEVIKGDDRAK